MDRIKEKTIIRFVKDNCANYDSHYQKCLFADTCMVMDGQRCGYFEKCVLGPPDYKYKLPGYDYARLFAQYAEQTGAQKHIMKVRRCECGAPLQLRRRYCTKCSKHRKKAANRKRQQKHYLQTITT